MWCHVNFGTQTAALIQGGIHPATGATETFGMVLAGLKLLIKILQFYNQLEQEHQTAGLKAAGGQTAPNPLTANVEDLGWFKLDRS